MLLLYHFFTLCQAVQLIAIGHVHDPDDIEALLLYLYGLNTEQTFPLSAYLSNIILVN